MKIGTCQHKECRTPRSQEILVDLDGTWACPDCQYGETGQDLPNLWEVEKALEEADLNALDAARWLQEHVAETDEDLLMGAAGAVLDHLRETDPERFGPEEGDVTTQDHRAFWLEGRQILDLDEDQDWEVELSRWSDQNGYYPGVWWISDHGNAHRQGDWYIPLEDPRRRTPDQHLWTCEVCGACGDSWEMMDEQEECPECGGTDIDREVLSGRPE